MTISRPKMLFKSKKIRMDRIVIRVQATKAGFDRLGCEPRFLSLIMRSKDNSISHLHFLSHWIMTNSTNWIKQPRVWEETVYLVIRWIYPRDAFPLLFYSFHYSLTSSFKRSTLTNICSRVRLIGIIDHTIHWEKERMMIWQTVFSKLPLGELILDWSLTSLH